MRFKRVLHVFRNTPQGRETLLGAAELCHATRSQLHVYLPGEPRFTLQLDADLIEVPLDRSYTLDPETARRHAEEALERTGVTAHWVEPSHRLASTMPVIQARFHVMSCPRSLSTPAPSPLPVTLGSRVRRLVRSAPFPLLIPTAPHLGWSRVTAFFAGSKHALRALLWARDIASNAGVPLEILTHAERGAVRQAERALKESGLEESLGPHWRVLEAPAFTSLLWEVPRESLVVAGAFGRSGVKAQFLGSRTEAMLAHLPNPLFLVGPAAPAPEES